MADGGQSSGGGSFSSFPAKLCLSLGICESMLNDDTADYNTDSPGRVDHHDIFLFIYCLFQLPKSLNNFSFS